MILSGQNHADDLTKALEKYAAESDLPGFAVAIVNEKKVLYQKAFGYADKAEQIPFQTTTVQNLGSVSKTIVGLALIKAVEDGKLTLDTEINDILPFQIINPYAAETPILVRHLANHTSGILDTKHYGKTYVSDKEYKNKGDVHPGYLEFINSHEEIELKDFLYSILSKKGKWYKKKNFLKTKAGTQKEYANLNAALAAYLIEVAAETPFKQYTQSKIFSPLKMENTAWDINEKIKPQLASLYFPAGKAVPRYKLITYPDGGLLSNASDLSLFLIEIIKAYAGNSEYLPPKYAKMLLPGDDDDDRTFWGMGEKSRNIGHGGSDPGVQTDLQFNADRKIGRVILTNVNAEDNDELWKQYRGIHEIIAKYEDKLK